MQRKHSIMFDTTNNCQQRRDEYATLTRHYYNLATDLYEYGWGQSFHFCRYAYGESFHQAIARHEHYLAHKMDLKDNMRVLDVGCGVGGPAREIVKFAGVNVVGLNNNDYQIERATRYAEKEGLSDKLKFTKGDFMVLLSIPHSLCPTDSYVANVLPRQLLRCCLRY
jgi:sterol 24-C-methyltransferase